MKPANKINRQFQGVVVSDKMNKTIVVNVIRIRTHPKYKKQYKVRKKYKVHDEKNECHVGDLVLFTECRPLSKEKKWRIVKKLSRNAKG